MITKYLATPKTRHYTVNY